MAMHESEAFWNEFFRRPGAQKAVQLEQRLIMKEAAADLKLRHEREKAEMTELLNSCSPDIRDLVQPMLGSSRVKRLLSAVRQRAADNDRSFEDELRSAATTLEKLEKLREEQEQSPAAFSAAEEYLDQVRVEAAKEIGPSDYETPTERTWRDIPQDELAERLCKGEICPREEWIPGLSKDKRPLDPESLDEHLKLGDRMLQDGREAYAAGDFDLASIRFTQGVQLLNWVKAARTEDQYRVDEMYLMHLRNQAQAALKLEKFQEAIRACTTIIQDIDEHDAKARYRRAQAYTMLGLIKCAKDDYVFILKSPYVDETAVKAARVALANLRRILNNYKLQTRKTVQRSVAVDVFTGDRTSHEATESDHDAFARGYQTRSTEAQQGKEQWCVSEARPPANRTDGNISGLFDGAHNDRLSSDDDGSCDDGAVFDDGHVKFSRKNKKKTWFDDTIETERPAIAGVPERPTGMESKQAGVCKHRKGNSLPTLPLEDTKLLLEDLLDCYTKPETQTQLQEASRAADFDMRRFLIRVRKYLPEIQRHVFERHHLPGRNNKENLRIMEKSVAWWRSQDETVDELRRECWSAIFGDLVDIDV
ncbi:TPR repeat-containing protein [Besnoitia besnoiti]|uniref:TPR repeat-containing protein n=1 Tax=Besnoitia besnoiti TaxID=94643 RepID=A0A2A9MMZ3_BESBE|nr:TPR repeat-containing protein [Besnoitia besnoiti]PFH36990.1 TPR repeat-containing protein [Besnoitia besnoiti]